MKRAIYITLYSVAAAIILAIILASFDFVPRPSVMTLEQQMETVIRKNDIRTIASRFTLKEVKEGKLDDLLKDVRSDPPMQFSAMTLDGWYIFISLGQHTNKIDFQKD